MSSLSSTRCPPPDQELQDRYRALVEKGFDAAEYARLYPDVSASGLSPLEHFVKVGRDLGRHLPLAAPAPRPADASAPKVSVICITYNHEKFIGDTLEGFLSQAVDFDVEFIVADDGSTDATPEIVREYAKRDSRIVPILRAQNVGVARNFADAASRCRGRYVAMCEGDDYWTDPTKLAAQAAVLDERVEVSLVFHPVDVVQDETGVVLLRFPHVSDESPPLWRLATGNFIQTNSVMYRWRFADGLPSWVRDDVKPLDWLLHLAHAQVGSIWFIDRTMAVYRKHGGGMWSTASNLRRHRRKHGLGEIEFFKEAGLLLGPLLSDRTDANAREIAVDVADDALLTGLGAGFDEIDPALLPDGYRDFRRDRPEPVKISVIVLTYNHGAFLEKCLASIVNQRGPFKLEILVCDDGSADSTCDVAEAFQQHHPGIVHLIRSETNQGMLKNMRSAIRRCTGDYIAFCEGDDYWLGDRKLLRQLLFLAKRSDFAMCFNWVMIDDDDGGSLYPHPGQAAIAGDEVLVSTMARDPLTANFSCCFYRGDAVRAVPEEYYASGGAADWLFNIHVGQIGRLGFVRETLSAYRVHSGGLWSSLSASEQKGRFAAARAVCAERFGRAHGFNDESLTVTVVGRGGADFAHRFSACLDLPAAGAGRYLERRRLRFRGWLISATRRGVRLLVKSGGSETFHSLDDRRLDAADLQASLQQLPCDDRCGFDFELPISGASETFELVVDEGGRLSPWCTVRVAITRDTAG